MSINLQSFRDLLDIDASSELELADSHARDKHDIEQESHLLRERDANNSVIAHYRVWTHQSLKPPYRRQRGWEKYSPDMKLLDREIRFSTPEGGNTLH